MKKNSNLLARGKKVSHGVLSLVLHWWVQTCIVWDMREVYKNKKNRHLAIFYFCLFCNALHTFA